MKYVDKWQNRSCGCRAQKALFRDSRSITHSTWVVRTQCEKHKAEHEVIMRWFNEGGLLLGDEDDD